MKKKKNLLFVSIVILIFVVVACSNKNTNSSAKKAQNKDNNQTNSEAKTDNSITTITDINNWNHPIKDLFKQPGLIKVELLKQKTYPIFYVDQPTIIKYDVINNYLSGTYLSMLGANGFWNFEIRSIDNKSIAIKGDKINKKISEIIFDNRAVDIQKYDTETKQVIKAITSRILRKDKSSNYYYFWSPSAGNNHTFSNEVLYALHSISYDSKTNAYIISFLGKTDNATINYYAAIKNNKVYLYYNKPTNNGNDREVDNDFVEVKNLFLSRYFIKDVGKSEGYYALKQSPQSFIYRIYVNEFDYSSNKYSIIISRSTDTAQNFFLYDADSNKFYREGTTPQEIKYQTDVFVWVP